MAAVACHQTGSSGTLNDVPGPPKLDAEKTRELIERALKNDDGNSSHGSPESLLDSLADRQMQRGDWLFDWQAGLTYWWELCRIGAVAIVGGGSGGVSGGRRRYIVTERGRALLSRGQDGPHDPDRYLSALKRRVVSPDPIVLAYLEEAAGTWKHGFYRASVVTLGCACERLIILLAEAIVPAKVAPYSDKIDKSLRREPPVGVLALFGEVEQALQAAAADRDWPRELGEQISLTLVPTFDHARRLRNAQGHPTGADVGAEDAEAGLLLFPGFYAFVQRVLVALRGEV